jgi:uncharacterized membrane protein
MTKKKLLLAASVAGLMAAAGAMTANPASAGMRATGADDVSCYGVNKCKGSGDCGGKGASCAGTNACKGQGFVMIPEEACLKLEGGRLTAE